MTSQGSRGEAIPSAASDVTDAVITARADSYFNRTKAVVSRFGDTQVTYAVFLRRPVIAAPRLMLDWLRAVAASRATAFQIEVMHEEGQWVGAGNPARAAPAVRLPVANCRFADAFGCPLSL